MSDRVPPPTLDKGCETYSDDNLPAKLWKKYFYCARFVDKVGAKTEKLIKYFDGNKCTLMEVNSFFEVSFNNGLKIHFLNDKIQIFDDHGLDTILKSNSTLTHLQPFMQDHLKIAKLVRNLYLIIYNLISYSNFSSGIVRV